jgi:hypothetical protein
VPMRRKELSGQRFGRWLVVKYSHTAGGHVRWVCRCDCGTEKIVRGSYLSEGSSRSCRCLIREKLAHLATKHGQATNARGNNPSPEYRAWASMINRCERPTYRGFHRYGGRGITICDRWRSSFESFFEDMGKRPSGDHSLDRFPNNDGNYEPGNCRWATRKEQAANRLDPWVTRRKRNGLRDDDKEGPKHSG